MSMNLSDERAKDITRLVGKFVQTNAYLAPLFGSLEDMHSEFTTAVLERYGKYDEKRGCISTFVYIVCNNYLRMQLRKSKRGKNVAEITSLNDYIGCEDDNLTLLDTIAADSIEDQLEAQIIVSQLLPYINLETRLYYLQGYTEREIGRIVGVSQTQVCRRIKDCINKLRAIVIAHRITYKRNSVLKAEEVVRERNCSVRTAYRILAALKNTK